MTKPVYILKGSNYKVKKISPEYKETYFGSSYHFINKDDFPIFTVSSETYGGIVKYKNNPIGVVTIPASITNDDSIRIVSIYNMSYTSPDTGTLNTETMKCPCGKFANYQSRFVNRFDATQKTYTASNFPVKSYQDGWVDYKVLIELSDSLLSASAGTEKQWRTTSQLNNNTNVYATAALAAWRYNPISSILNMQGYWYIPSWFELFHEYLNQSAINQGFSQIKTDYDIGLGRIPYYTGNDRTQYSYWGSTYKNYQSTWGGNCCKLNVRTGFNTSTYYGTSSDPGMAQAFLKLIKDKGKWILDPNYHID